jgi:hypothetical protein
MYSSAINLRLERVAFASTRCSVMCFAERLREFPHEFQDLGPKSAKPRLRRGFVIPDPLTCHRGRPLRGGRAPSRFLCTWCKCRAFGAAKQVDVRRKPGGPSRSWRSRPRLNLPDMPGRRNPRPHPPQHEPRSEQDRNIIARRPLQRKPAPIQHGECCNRPR